VIDVTGFLLHIHVYGFSRWYREAYREIRREPEP
jgi:hypothetical protein